MTDPETTPKTEDQTSTDTGPTDAELDAARQPEKPVDLSREQMAAAEAEPEVPELPEEHKERSDLGRKIAALHRRNDEMQIKLDQALQRIESYEAAALQKTPTEPERPFSTFFDESDETDAGYISKKDIPRVLEEYEAEKIKQQQAARVEYSKSYLNVARIAGKDLNDNDYLEVINLVTNDDPNNPFNKVRTGVAETDAYLNVADAHRAILKQRLSRKPGARETAEPENPLLNEQPKGPLGRGPNAKTESVPTAPLVVDKDTKEFLDYVAKADGKPMSEEEVKKTLEGPIPSYLTGGGG